MSLVTGHPSPTFSFEFFPPKTPEGKAKLRATWQQLAQLKPRFFSVTFGAGGATPQGTLDTGLGIRAPRRHAAPPISLVASSQAEIAAPLAGFPGKRTLTAIR